MNTINLELNLGITLRPEPLRFTTSDGKAIPYIALEGVKGVGKGTVLKELSEILKQSGINAVYLKPTQSLGDDSYWEQIDCELPLRHLDWWREHLYAARSELHTASIREQISKSEMADKPIDVVIGDRSIITSVVTRCPDRPCPEELLKSFYRVRKLERSIPTPDTIIWLDITWGELSKRLLGRERSYGLQDETKTRIMAAREAYCSLSQYAIACDDHSPLGLIKWIKCNASTPVHTTARRISRLIITEVMGERPA